MVPAHVNYLPGTPSPTFPGLQSTILQTGGEENFPIDFLHESDLRGGLCTKLACHLNALAYILNASVMCVHVTCACGCVWACDIYGKLCTLI